ncbi:class I SAM-dependent methyltransferase [Nonomuraea sp. 3-1Str]|uniref:class I SAM-dependent methyltransferase n=1 Tax=Nonomuraea sp. 3-1Str TaxID=2929801 RepID=UPI0028643077|nr:class I SAM-dependent methyltransferase [Nonomuraea sp. 3-1Str]MDR8414806.1 class I SAM-dependent methyltransferase [Nonomuraea sp. 3-1Str]
MDGRGHRCFAMCYDAITRVAERYWLGAVREELVGGLGGRVLEIGAGSGANLAHYRAAGQVVAAEPDAAMRRRLRARPAGAAVPVRVLAARGERLPFADASFDAVVATLVLCSVDDPGRTLAEVRRVLKPAGRFVFFEHVRGTGARGRIQDLLTPLWRRLGAGCHLNRRSLATIEHAGLAVHDVRTFAPRPNLPVTVPMIRGVATRAGPPR